MIFSFFLFISIILLLLNGLFFLILSYDILSYDIIERKVINCSFLSSRHHNSYFDNSYLVNRDNIIHNMETIRSKEEWQLNKGCMKTIKSWTRWGKYYCNSLKTTMKINIIRFYLFIFSIIRLLAISFLLIVERLMNTKTEISY